MTLENETRPVATGAGQGDQVAAPIYIQVYRGCTRSECTIKSSMFHRCDVCRGQLNPDHYAARMKLFAEAAERFSEQQLGRPYAPFMGRAA